MIFQKRWLSIEKEDFLNNSFLDGDVVFFKEINNDNISGLVKIGGAVNISGKFQLEKNNTVAELINSAKGFSFDKLGANGILFRNNKGLQNQSISIDLNNDLSFKLINNDSLYIPSAKDILFDETIEIKGEVNFPKEVRF